MATIRKTRSSGTGALEILSKDPDLLKEIARTAIQELPKNGETGPLELKRASEPS